MSEIAVNGHKVRYELQSGVSLNRANPHLLIAFCDCGVQFMQMAASDRCLRREHAERLVRKSHDWHVSSAYCKASRLGKG